MFEFLERISDKVFTEAGLLAGILFIYAIYLTLDNKSWRRENRELHEKVYNMGLKQIETAVENNAVLDKLVTTIGAISEKKER